MKKISLTLAAASLTASLGAFAALPTDAQPYQVVVPNLKSGISITLEGLYLQPTNSNLDYTTVSKLTGDHPQIIEGFVLPDSISNSVQTVNPDYNFGFRVALGYTFADSGNDVQVAWTHFNHSNSGTTTLIASPTLTALTSALGNIAFLDSSLDSEEEGILLDANQPLYEEATVTSDVKFKLDAIDLNVGQFVDIGTRLRMRMFGGLRFAQVTNNQTSTTNGAGHFETGEIGQTIFDLTGVDIEQFNSKFSGVGPQVGVDSSYHIGHCFGVAAHAAVGLLVGSVDTSTTASNSFSRTRSNTVQSVTTTHIVDFDIASDDDTRLVPTLDAKLGLNWSYIFGNQSLLTLEGGYQWTQYIDAVDKLTAGQGLEGGRPPAGNPLNVTRTTSSVGFDGPYLTLNWSV